MVDLLTHVLSVYVVLTIASWYVDGIDAYVGVGMIGAIVPDLAKARLLIDPDTIESILQIPFSWNAFHRLGGVLVVVGIGSLLFDPKHRSRVFGFLCVGAISALVLDLGVIRAGGVAPPYLYPFSWYEPPAANLYLSSDQWPAIVASAFAIGTWLVDRKRSASAGR